MKEQIKTRKVLVTGAASGIGRALCREFDAQGTELYMIDKDLDGMKKVSETLKTTHTLLPCDLSKEDQIREACSKISSVDIIINCAAQEIHGLVEDVPSQSFHYSFNVNFFAPLLIIQCLVPKMKKQGSGVIVNISSAMGRRSVPGKSAYCSTKFALNALTESLRSELKPYGIHVMMVSPGPVNTNIQKNLMIFGNLNFGYEAALNRQDPSVVAKAILRGIEQKRRDVKQFSFTEIFLILNTLFPPLGDWLIDRKMQMKKISSTPPA